MKPPIKDVPVEVNRRLDNLERTTHREMVIKTIREVPVSGGRSDPVYLQDDYASIGSVETTESTITLTALPRGRDFYEFGIQKVGTEGWDRKLVKDPIITFRNLESGTQFECAVRVVDTGGYSYPWSSSVITATTIDTEPPPVPTGLTLVAESTFIRAKVDEMDQLEYPDFAGFEWHASIENDFTPDDSTFKDSSRTCRTIFHVSDVGITWYVKVRSYDQSGNYSDYCSQVSVAIPPPTIPPAAGDPVDTGDMVISEGSLELEDCDSPVADWEADSDAIAISAAEGGQVKEGTGAMKVTWTKYVKVIEQEVGEDDYKIGDVGNTTYWGQRVQATANFNLQRVEVMLSKIGAPANLVCKLYSDAGGDPNALIDSATFTGIGTEPEWCYADFAVPPALVNGTWYWIILTYGDFNPAKYYIFQASNENEIGGTGELRFGDDESLNMGTCVFPDMMFRLFKDESVQNKHFYIKALGAKDLSEHDTIEFWVRGSTEAGASGLKVSMGEAALDEQLDDVVVPALYQTHVWDITGIAVGNRDGITKFGFKITNPNAKEATLYIDYCRAVEQKKVKVKFSDEVAIIYPQVTGLGDWVSKNENTVYQADAAGFFMGMLLGTANQAGIQRLEAYSDENNPPVTVRGYATIWGHGAAYFANGMANSFCIPVKKGDYYKAVKTDVAGALTTTRTYYFIPLE